jgi:hypothetical protein
LRPKTIGEKGRASAAWCLAQFIVHNFMLVQWPAEVRSVVWKQRDALISGILAPRLGEAWPVQKGYNLTGTWPFLSGVEGSEWCILSAVVQLAGEPPDQRYFIVPTESVTVLDTWRATGLDSGSADATVQDLFVPEEMTLPIQHLRGGSSPGGELNPEPIYRAPAYMTRSL